jgi:hypothetical protein
LRVCNANVLKTTPFYKEFNWDDLIDFRLKPPYIPKELREWSNNLANLNNPFEEIIHVLS